METVLEYIKLLERRPDVGEMLLISHARRYDLDAEDQMALVKLWSQSPNVAEKVLTTYIEHKLLREETLIELFKLWQNGSASAGNFCQMYSKGRLTTISCNVDLYLIDLWQNGSKEAGDFLLNYGKKHTFRSAAQVKFIDLFPNSIAIMLMRSQKAYSKDALLKLLDIWAQFPDEVSGMLLSENGLKSIFTKNEVLFKVMELIEEKPEDAKKIMIAYLQHDNLSYTNYQEVQNKILDYIENGSKKVSSVAKELMILFVNRVFSFDKDLCKKVMKLFKADPENMYDILQEMVQHIHSDTIDANLIELWQSGSNEAYKLLLVTKDISKDNLAKIFNLWRQNVPGAYKILNARGTDLFLGDKEQLELVELLGEGSKEAYNLLFAHTYYPGHSLCAEALVKLAKYEQPRADEILKRAIRTEI